MKKSFLVLLFALFLASPAWSYTINSGATDVGALDNLVAAALLGDSGDDTELNWVKTVLSDSTITMDLKLNWGTYSYYAVDNQPTKYAIDLQSNQPEYFLVKVGVGENDPQYSHFLYENLVSLYWGVIDLQTTYGTIKEIGKVSHIDEFNAQVPEPGTMLLLGGLLFGLGVVNRKRIMK
jgi:hypothetical protein